MQKISIRVLILTVIYFKISFLDAQVIREQLRTIPIEVTQAKLIGQDLYVGGEDGLYYTRLDSIDFKSLYSGSVSSIRSTGQSVVFDSRGGYSHPPIYCNQLGGLRGATTLSTSVVHNGTNISTGNAYSYQHHDISTVSAINYGVLTTSNGVSYSRIYRNSGWPGNHITGSPVAIDQFGKKLGSTSIQFQDFASDDDFYYATFDGELYRSTSPIFDENEIIESPSGPSSFYVIRVINGKLVSTTGGLYISEDHGESWQEEVYPHDGLWFDDFIDGYYYFNDSDKNIRVRTDAYLSTDYDTVYNFTTDAFVNGKQLFPLNLDTLLVVEDQTLFISFDRGATWSEKFIGFWMGSLTLPAVTNQARFFHSQENLWKTEDEGLSFVELNPKFTTISGDTIVPSVVKDLKGHNDVLFYEVTIDDKSNSLFRSIDQGESFNEIFEIESRKFYNGVNLVFAVTTNGINMSSNDGEDWSEISIPEIENFNAISDIQQEENFVLVEYNRSSYYISYDLGTSFSKIEVPDSGEYKFSLANGKIFGIRNQGRTWIKNSEASSWVKVNDKASYFDLYPGSSSFSATKIFAIGSVLYSNFTKAGYIYELCHSTSVSELQYSTDFGKTWSSTSLLGWGSFTHNGTHYRYSDGFYRYNYDEGLEPNSSPDLSVDIIETNVQPTMTLGDTIQINFQLANLSSSDTNISHTSVVTFSKQGAPSYISDTLTYDAFDAFEGSNHILSIPIDSNYTVGQHHVQFRTDIYNIINESSETNNFIKIEFNIIPKDTIIKNEFLQLCEEDSYNGVTLEQDTLLESVMEDIFVHQITFSEIKVLPLFRDTIYDRICPKESLVVNNEIYNTPGVHLTESLTSISTGCDSLFFLNLSQFEDYSTTLYLNLENGEYFKDEQIFQDTIIFEENFDINGCLVTHTYNISVSNIVSVSNPSERFYSISPNPTSDIINILLEDVNSIDKIEIIDLNGKIIELGTPTIVSRTIKLDLSFLTSGTYFIRISNAGKSHTSKIIKL